MRKKRMLSKSYYQILVLFLLVLCLLGGSFFQYALQSRHHIEEAMYEQVQAAAMNSTHLLQQEVNALKRITNTAAALIKQNEYTEEQEIIDELKYLSEKGVLVRTLFITLDGYAYTSYAGSLGQSDENLRIGDVFIKDITTTSVMQPFYSDDFQSAIFGVATPLSMGQYKGILISSYNMNDFYQTFKSDLLKGSIQTGIVSQDGKVVLGQTQSGEDVPFGTDIFQYFEKDAKGNVEQMRRDFKTGGNGILTYEVNGKKRYAAYMPADVNGWQVISTIPEDILRAQVMPIQKSGSLLGIKLMGIMVIFFVVVMLKHRNDEKKIQKVLKDLAMYDGLTHLYNRITAEKMLIDILNRNDVDCQHCMFIIDIDYFKEINDTYGHIAGDEALIVFANRLKQVFQQDAIVSRLGGDEFLVFLQNYESREKIVEKAEQIIMPIQVEKIHHIPPISVSLGISLYPQDGSSFMELYHCGDQALYQAKQMGKNGYAFYEEKDKKM